MPPKWSPWKWETRIASISSIAMPSWFRPLPVVVPQSISTPPDGDRSRIADWRRPPAPNASLVPTKVSCVTRRPASRFAPSGARIERVEPPARKHTVARAAAVGYPLSVPYHDASQPSSSAEARASANHVVALEADAGCARDRIGVEIRERGRSPVCVEVFRERTDRLPGTRNERSVHVARAFREVWRQPVVQVTEHLAVGHRFECARGHRVRPGVESRAHLVVRVAPEAETRSDPAHHPCPVDADTAELHLARVLAQEQRNGRCALAVDAQERAEVDVEQHVAAHEQAGIALAQERRDATDPAARVEQLALVREG